MDVEVLQAIYPELEVYDDDLRLELDVSVELEAGESEVTFLTAAPTKVRYLPPCRLRINEGGAGVALDCAWLPLGHSQRVLEHCARLEEVYDVIDHIITSSRRAFDMPLVQLDDALSPLLRHHDAVERRREFDRRSYACEICLDFRPGADCLEVPGCGHLFCRDCLRDMFALHIREGDVDKVRCPIGCEGALPTSTLSLVVSEEEVARYVKLCIKQRIEALPTSTHCPREFCAQPLERDPDEKLVVCGACEYAFCADCLRGWHGDQEPCRRQTLSFAFADRYLASTEEERRKLDRLYGAKNIRRLLLDVEHERLAQKWFDQNTTPCPECGAQVEKSMGCNHILCRCGHHYCYLCGETLSKLNPYTHYSDKGLSCYGQLFAGLTGLEDDFPEMGFG